MAAAAVLLLRGADRSTEPPGEEGWREEVLGGIRHLCRTPPLGRLAVIGALAMAATGLGSAAQFALLDALHRPPAFLGVLVSLLGAGSIAAGLLSGAYREICLLIAANAVVLLLATGAGRVSGRSSHVAPSGTYRG